ncbi:MAG: hypothetical protein C4325_06925 [Blastocatellia bacterium]
MSAVLRYLVSSIFYFLQRVFSLSLAFCCRGRDAPDLRYKILKSKKSLRNQFANDKMRKTSVQA